MLLKQTKNKGVVVEQHTPRLQPGFDALPAVGSQLRGGEILRYVDVVVQCGGFIKDMGTCAVIRIHNDETLISTRELR